MAPKKEKMNPTGKRREKQKAETRALILESARHLFEAEGFKATTMRNVAIKAEIGLGTIYKHFKNKAALLVAALLEGLTHLYATATEKLPSDMPLRQQLVQMARPFYAYYTARPALARAYLTNLFAMDDDLLAPVNAFDRDYAETISRLVRQAQKGGELDAEKETAFVTMAFMAAYFYVLVTCFLRSNETDPEKMLATLDALLAPTIAR